jgi:hypothetical protein
MENGFIRPTHEHFLEGKIVLSQKFGLQPHLDAKPKAASMNVLRDCEKNYFK